MKLTPDLTAQLYRGFKRDAAPFLALRIRYDGGLVWKVEDRVLTLTVTGGPGTSQVINLPGLTIARLVQTVAALPGYTTPYVTTPDLAGLAASVLLDGTGDQDQSNGDHLNGYTSLTWAYLDAMAVELTEAARQIDQMLLQMSPGTAEAQWLDLWGNYFGIPRMTGEADRPYGTRMIVEVLRPRGNNVALEVVISEALGQPAEVTDVVNAIGFTQFYDGSRTFGGTSRFDGGYVGQIRYGLFDVRYAYDLLSGYSPDGYAEVLRKLIDRSRDAGTHLRALVLTGTVISEAGPGAVDGSGPQALALVQAQTDAGPGASDDLAPSAAMLGTLTDAGPGSSEQFDVDVLFTTLYNGVRAFDGSVPYASGQGVHETC